MEDVLILSVFLIGNKERHGAALLVLVRNMGRMRV